MNSRRKRGANKLPAKAQNSQNPVQKTPNPPVAVAQWEAPLPPPAMLDHYDQLVPGAAERILRMAEAEQASRHKNEAKSIDAQVFSVKWQTVTESFTRSFGTLFLYACFAVSVYFAAVVQDLKAAALFFSPLIVVWVLRVILGQGKK